MLNYQRATLDRVERTLSGTMLSMVRFRCIRLPPTNHPNVTCRQIRISMYYLCKDMKTTQLHRSKKYLICTVQRWLNLSTCWTQQRIWPQHRPLRLVIHVVLQSSKNTDPKNDCSLQTKDRSQELYWTWEHDVIICGYELEKQTCSKWKKYLSCI